MNKSCKRCDRYKERLECLHVYIKENYRKERIEDVNQIKEYRIYIAEILKQIVGTKKALQEISLKLKKLGNAKQYHNYLKIKKYV